MSVSSRYGDIVPYTAISRIFTIIWILIGLITAAILIGGISTALTSNIAMTDTKLYGIKVSICLPLFRI